MTKKIILNVLKEIKKEKKEYLYLVLLNFLIWIFYAILGQIIFYFTNINMEYLNMLNTSWKSFIGLVAFISYLVVPTLPYSFFKLIILSKIAKRKNPMKLFWRFYINNVIIFIFINILIVIWLFLGSGFNEFQMLFYMLLTVPPIFFFIGSFISLYHSLTIKENNTRMIKPALNFTFRKIPKYWTIIIPNIAVFLCFLLLWGVIGTLLSLLHLQPSYNIPIYNLIFSITFYALLLFLAAFNQFFFYKTVLGHTPE